MPWFILLGILFAAGCTSWKVKEAFDGEYSSTENNRIINDYCQQCHIHRTFSSGPHLDAVAQKYNRKVFRYATECRTCHFLEMNMITEEIARRTRTPERANRGEYKDFEIDKLKEQRERAKEEVFKKPPVEEVKEEEKFLGIF